MKKLSLLLLLLPFLMVNCEDVTEEDHHDIVGVRLSINGNVVASTNGTEVTGSIPLTAATTSESISVEFLEPDGAASNDELESDSNMSVEIGTAAVATINLDANSKWSFSITGVAEGTTAVTISLNHGDHADFISREIPVIVSAQ